MINTLLSFSRKKNIGPSNQELLQAAFRDRNTSYFHVSTVVRRQKNKIRCLKNSVEEWIDNEKAIKKHILVGFEKLYSTKMCMSSRQSSISEFASAS